MNSNGHKREYLKTAAIGLLVVALLALAGMLRDFRQDFESSRNDTRCVLRELNDHRHNNFQADRRTAAQVGVPVDDLDPPPTLPRTPEWAHACQDVLEGEHRR